MSTGLAPFEEEVSGRALGNDATPPSDTGDKWLDLPVNGKADGEHTAAYDRVPMLLAARPS